ncbi:MAG: c-type cytochrome [Pseudomonadota bacterium]
MNQLNATQIIINNFVLYGYAIIIFVLAVFSTVVFADAKVLHPGAEIYFKYCTLCHGQDGMGEGVLPLRIPDYPATSFFKNPKAQSVEEIADVVRYGREKDPKLSNYMPPWGDELIERDIFAVSEFVQLLRTDNKTAREQVLQLRNQAMLREVDGQKIFQDRCVLCHGRTGHGDGRMSRVIKDPPPFNLTESNMPKEYLELIISNGGAAVGRSPQMPPWKDQLSKPELDALIDYLMKLRH